MSSEVAEVTITSPDVIMILIPLLLLLLLLTIGILVWHSGLFITPDVKTCKPPFDELEVAYKFVRGSHKDCSLVYAEAHSLAPELRCIGVYYDNPQEVGDSYMRSIVGVILNDKDKTLSEEDRQRLVVKGFQIAQFPAVELAVYADFPHSSFLSVLVAVNKVVPSLRAYIQEMTLQAYPLIEICDGHQIVYAAPLSKQSEFFVYEALAESEEDITSEKTVDETEELSSKDLEELPDTVSSVEGAGSKVEELPSNEEILESLEDKNKDFGSCGQNIFVANVQVPWFFAIKVWFMERQNFTYGEDINNANVVGHYTQMVWYSTHKVGCGFNYCPMNNITQFPYFSYVCNYCPIGNHPERFDRPYTNGTACSECEGYCKFNKLCTNGCPYADFWTNCDEFNSTNHDWLCDDENTDRFQSCRSTCRCNGKIR